MARKSLYQKFTTAYNNIAKAIDVISAIDEFIKDEDRKDMAYAYLGIRENGTWATFRLTSKAMAIIFVYPILTPLFYICTLPLHVIYHAVVNSLELLSTLFKPVRSPHVNNAHAANQQGYTDWVYSKIPSTPPVITRGINLIWSYMPSRPSCLTRSTSTDNGREKDLDRRNSNTPTLG